MRKYSNNKESIIDCGVRDTYLTGLKELVILLKSSCLSSGNDGKFGLVDTSIGTPGDSWSFLEAWYIHTSRSTNANARTLPNQITGSKSRKLRILASERKEREYQQALQDGTDGWSCDRHFRAAWGGPFIQQVGLQMYSDQLVDPNYFDSH